MQGVLKNTLRKIAEIRKDFPERNNLEGVSTLDEYIERIGWRAKVLHLWIALMAALAVIIIIATEKNLSTSHKALGFLVVLLILCAVVLFLIKRIPKGYLAENVWKVECPNCYDYIPFDNWYSKCQPDVIVHESIFIGCSNCGTKFGYGERDLRSLDCEGCNEELWFEDEYDFKNWSVLGKGQTYEELNITKDRPSYLLQIGELFLLPAALGLIFTARLFIQGYAHATPLFTLPVPPTGVLNVFWFELLFVGSMGVYFLLYVLYIIIPRSPKILIENPTYRRRHEE